MFQCFNVTGYSGTLKLNNCETLYYARYDFNSLLR